MSKTHENAKTLFPVCALGASAGGLEALEHFFSELGDVAKVAFIVIQHMSSEFESRLVRLLARHTDLTVEFMQHESQVRPGIVYVCVPGKDAIVLNGRFALTDTDNDEAMKRPIDKMFRSLAHEYGNRVTAIVLSGTGDDGAAGTRVVFQAGGHIMAQLPAEATFDGMPISVIETGDVHEVGSVDRLVQRLRSRVEAPSPVSTVDTLAEAQSLDQQALEILGARYTVPFDAYKPGTLLRRMERRRAVENCDTLSEFIELIESDEAALDRLYFDLLIGVTSFFRDPAVFEALSAELSNTLDKLAAGLRVWVPGCATGEEAFSLVITLRDLARRHDIDAWPTVTATDVNDRSLEQARLGVYPSSSVTSLSPELVERYFTVEGEHASVGPELAACVSFESADLLNDVPPGQMDLVSCRNLLIYLNGAAQSKALNLMHFALRANGLLLLGKSESVGSMSSEFKVIDPRNRLFRKKRAHLPVGRHTNRIAPKDAVDDSEATSRQSDVAEYVDLVMAQYAPPVLVIDSRFELKHAFNGAETLLTLPAGQTTTYLPDLVVNKARSAVITALTQARQMGESTPVSGLSLSEDDNGVRYTMSVSRLNRSGSDQSLFSVEFRRVDQSGPHMRESQLAAGPEEANYVEQLERQLLEARDDLQATIEELETSNEELQAANEELLSSNDELNSYNIELQSVNQRLREANSAHAERVVEVESLNRRVEMLLEQTNAGAIYLDGKLAIVHFTDRVADLLDLQPQDTGRSFQTFSSLLDIKDLDEALDAALTRGRTTEFTVAIDGKAVHLMRVVGVDSALPYNGCIVLFVDISELYAETQQNRELAELVNQARDAIFSWDIEGRIRSWNQGAELLFGYATNEIIGQSIDRLLPGRGDDAGISGTRAVLEKQSAVTLETTRLTKSGEHKDVLLTVFPVLSSSGQTVAISSIAYDLTQQKKAEAELRDTIAQREQFVALLSHEIRNPVMTLLSSATVLQLSDAPQSERDAAAESISRQAKYLSSLLEDMLDASRMRRDRIEMLLQPIDFSNCVREAIAAVQRQAARSSVRITTAVDEDVLAVNGDGARLRQLLVNLLSNAIKYSNSDTEVRCRTERKADHVVLTVSDEGIGMDQETLQRVFEPFYRGQISKNGSGSMGLGLALVKSIVEGHGGVIKVSSDGLGKGSEVEVRLPSIDQSLINVGNVRNARKKESAVRHLRVLLVDDDDDGRRALAFLLGNRGHTITEAASGEAGLHEFDGGHYDAVLLDIDLPGMSGLEVGKEIRRRVAGRDVLLIALSGFGQASDFEKTTEAGFDQHYVKPVEIGVIDQFLIGDHKRS